MASTVTLVAGAHLADVRATELVLSYSSEAAAPPGDQPVREDAHELKKEER